MYKKLLLAFSIFILQINFSFAQYLGGSNNDRGVSFCQSTSGDFYLTGKTRSYGAGSDDIWLIKVRDNFTTDFHTEWGGIHRDEAKQIINTSDGNLVMIGYSWDAIPWGRNDVVLIKFDLEGSVIWSSYFGGYDNDDVNGIFETSDSGFLITGLNRVEGSIGSAFLIKTDALGNLEWQQFYDTPKKDIGIDVIETNNDSLLILVNTNSFLSKTANSSEYKGPETSGFMLIKTDIEGNEAWRKSYGGAKFDFAKKIISDGNGDFYILGSSMNNSNGSFDITLHKINNQGDIIWQKHYGGLYYDYGNDIDINTNEELLITGYTGSFSSGLSPYIYIIKLDSDGNEIWTDTYGGTGSNYGNCGQFLNDGNIAILGSAENGSDNKLDLYFIKLSESGEIINTLSEDSGISNHLSDNQVSLYPNPANTFINININNSVPHQNVEFILSNISGQIVFRIKYNNTSRKKISLNPDLQKGIYTYSVITDTKSFNGKLIIN